VGSRHLTYHDFTWDYNFPLPRLDIQQDFRTQTPGTFSRLVGVDGRYAGRLRRFPGWKQVESITLGTVTVGGANTELFMPFAIQKGATGSNVIRGILFLGQDGGSDKLYAFFSDDDGSSPTAPALGIVHTFGSGTSAPVTLDVAMDHELLYIVGEDGASPPAKIERLARYTGITNGWKSATWVTTAPPRPSISVAHTKSADTFDTSGKDTGHLAPGDVLGFCYRLVYPEQGFVGALSSPQEFETDTPNNEATLVYVKPAPSNPESGYGNVFSRAFVQIFRTTGNKGLEEKQAQGTLYLEAEWEVPRVSGSMSGTFLTNTGYDDSRTIKAIEDISGMGIAVGDIIYLALPVLTRDALDTSDNRNNYGVPLYRRTVETVDTGPAVGSQTITFDRTIGGRPDVNVTGNGQFWVSRVGDGDDTTADYGSSDKLVGWVPELVGKTPASDTPVGLDDRALILQPSLDPVEFSTFNKDGNPRARLIEEYENIFVRVTSASKEAGGQNVLRWGFADRPRKGLIPVLNRRVLSDLTDNVVGLLKADPFLVVIMNNGTLRIHRSGSRLAVDPIHNRFGTVSVDSAIVVGTNLYFASPSGILLIDLTTGQVDALNATQHFFDEGGTGTGNWRDDLDEIDGAYDAQLGALMFLNKTKFEMLVVWLNYGVFTHLVDVPFDRLVSSGNLQSGGLRRALFFNATAGTFHEIDAARAADSRTTFSYKTDGTETSAGLTYNGTTTGATATKLTDSAATFNANMKGHFVRVRQSDGVWKRARITAVSQVSGPGILVLDTDIAAAADLRYAIGAIPFQVTMHPLSGDPNTPVLDLFAVKKVTAMGAAVANLSRAASATYDTFLYQLFERGHDMATASAASGDANTETAEKAIDGDKNANNFAAIQRNHSILVPGLEVWSSNLDLDLLGVVVHGKIERSLKDTRP
jgi:hypothetical protein